MSNLDRSFPALPGAWFKGHLRAAVSTRRGGVPHHESARCHSLARGQRLPHGPAEGQPSAIQGHGQRAKPWSHGCREGKRGNRQVHTCIDQAAVRLAKRTVSAQLSVGQCQPIRFQNKAQRHCVSSMQSTQDAQQGHLPPDVPRCFSRQPAASLLRRQSLRTLQIKLNAGCQGSSRFLQRIAIGGDIEICTNRVPPITAQPRITLKGQIQIHTQLPDPACHSRFVCQSTTSEPYLLEHSPRHRLDDHRTVTVARRGRR